MELENKIYLCATPIGNLSDITNRCKDVLLSVDVIYCEDTRITKKLLELLNIKNTVKRCDENNIRLIGQKIIDYVKDGKSVAYCTDAGSPCISDPGSYLVKLAHKNNVKVDAVPGACAYVSAFVLSGFSTKNIYFGGFLPKKEQEIVNLFNTLLYLDSALVFYESPKRVVKTLSIIKDVVPDRLVCFARELTKIHQEVIVDTPLNLYNRLNDKDKILGEITLVIDASSKKLNNPKINMQKFLKTYYLLEKSGLKKSTISKILSIMFDISKTDAYNIMLESKN